MFIYSKKIIQFINEIKRTVKAVLSREIQLHVRGDRFENRQRTGSYPIKIVIYNNKKLLGYFDSGFYELGFHECLMHSSREQLHNVIRHELAHYMNFIENGSTFPPHGTAFKDFCTRMKWGEEISQAAFCLDGGVDSPQVEESSVLRKIQKLMALATSNNTHEAEQAMIKSQQLLLKHNIETTSLSAAAAEDEEQIFVKRIIKQKKEDAKMRAISNILDTFFVSTLYDRADGFTYLTILGNEVNIEVAEYVADFLQRELDNLWNQAQQQAGLKGLLAKNSFFTGLARGYCDKIKALKREYQCDVRNAVMVIEKALVDARALIFPRLTSVKSSGGYCRESSLLGELAGRQLSINPGVSQAQASKNSGLLIGRS